MEWWGNSYLLGPVYDADAQAYITAVEAADGQALETTTRDAYNAFVVGLKTDGILTAIKCCCILAGARTLSGALVPLVGPTPTNVGFVSGDYNRQTGLLGNGTTKYLNTNRTGNADPQNSHHQAVWLTTAATNSGVCSGVEGATSRNTIYSNGFALRQAAVDSPPSIATETGLRGASRSASNLTSWIAGEQSGTYSTVSTSGTLGNIMVYARQDNSVVSNYSNGRIAFYSNGENINLALLKARVQTLITAIAAIP